MKIEKAVALVTGANRGIGKDIVDALVKAGAKKVYAAARDISTVNGSDVIQPLELDVTRKESVAEAAATATDANLLINNAGVLDFGDILSVTDEQLKHNFDVNFFGVLDTAREFTPVIESNGGGAIVNLLTLLSLASMPGFAAYNASKAAAWSLHLSLRAILAERGVDVVGVFPGAVDTDMLAGVEMDKTAPSDVAQAIVAGIEKGEEDIFPDPTSKEVYAAWCSDHKAVEKQFAQY